MSAGIIQSVVDAFEREHEPTREPFGVVTTSETIDTYRIEALALAGCFNAREIIITERKDADAHLPKVAVACIEPAILAKTIANDIETHAGHELSEAALMELAFIQEDPHLCMAEWR